MDKYIQGKSKGKSSFLISEYLKIYSAQNLKAFRGHATDPECCSPVQSRDFPWRPRNATRSVAEWHKWIGCKRDFKLVFQLRKTWRNSSWCKLCIVQALTCSGFQFWLLSLTQCVIAFSLWLTVACFAFSVDLHSVLICIQCWFAFNVCWCFRFTKFVFFFFFVAKPSCQSLQLRRIRAWG